MSRLLYGAIILSALNATSSLAQAANSVVRLEGTVVDSSTGLGIPRTLICSWTIGQYAGRFGRCARGDSGGAFVLDSIPAAWESISVYCETLSRWESHRLADISSRKHGLPPQPWTFRTSAAGCDPRPFLTVTGVFGGFYQADFEMSSLSRCDAPDQRTWVTWGTAGAREYNQRVKAIPWDSLGRGVFMMVKGVLTGPGKMGHMGVYEYDLSVDSLVAIGPPGDCQ